MLRMLEMLKDTLQSAVDQGATRVERIHDLVIGYVKQTGDRVQGKDVVDRKSVYDLVRAINREVGEMATDMFELVEDAEAAIAARSDDVPEKAEKS
ncbi:MAG: hypothetical protein U0807_08710 [Candidatus Binatia bacterium]